MKTLKFTSLALLIMALVSFTGVSLSYSSSNDDNHLSANDSVYSPPGYMNKDIQQARSLTDKYLANKDKADNKTEATQREVSQKVQTQAIDKPKPQLKQKQSSATGKDKSRPSALNSEFDVKKYNVKIGDIQIGNGDSGTQMYSGTGDNKRLISEKVNGVTSIYVGFGYAGTDTINEAMNLAKSGDTIWVSANKDGYNDNISMRDGVKLYGVVDEGGNAPALYGTIGISGAYVNNSAEVAGFKIANSPKVTNSWGVANGINISSRFAQIKIWGNTFTGLRNAVYAPKSYNITLENNVFYNNNTAIFAGTGTFRNNLFQSNSTALSSGWVSYDLRRESQGSVLLENNVFYSNSAGVEYNFMALTTNSYVKSIITARNNIFQYSEFNNMSNQSIAIDNNANLSVTGNFFWRSSQLGASMAATNTNGDWRTYKKFLGAIDPATGLFKANFSSIGTQLSSSPDYAKLAVLGNPAAKNAYASFEMALTSSYANSIDSSFANAYYYNRANDDFLSSQPSAFGYYGKSTNNDAGGPALKTLLMNSIIIAQGGKVVEGSESSGRAKTLAGEFALSTPIPKYMDPQNVEAAARLASILNNPTEGQKVIIDSIKALLIDMDNIANQSPELKKASDDLLQMVANILLAQAVPDLLNKGDVSNIKAMFSELDTQRNKIMLEYAQSTKPYYENMIKDMAKNMAMLQSKNLLNPNMSKDELSKLPPSELDKILDKIRNMKDKSFEEKYLLQQEAKYRQDYLDPNNKKLESDMKGMLKNFTGRINDVLKSSEKK